MKRCGTSLTRSGLPRVDGSRPCLVRALMRRTPITCMLTWRRMERAIVIASANDAPLVRRLPFQRQPHRLPARHRALDRNGSLEIDARLRRRRVHGRGAGREVIEPGAGLVAERAPEIPDRPVACGVAAEKRA